MTRSRVNFNYQSTPRNLPEERICHLNCGGSLKSWMNINCWHFPGLEFKYLPERAEGLFSQGRRKGWILKIAYLLENHIGKDDWQCPYIRATMPLYTSYWCNKKKWLMGKQLIPQNVWRYRRGVAQTGYRYNRAQLYLVFNNLPFKFKLALYYTVSNALNTRQLYHTKCKICRP